MNVLDDNFLDSVSIEAVYQVCTNEPLGRRRGAYIRVRCPSRRRANTHSHGDAKPSATLNTDRGRYFCICRESGDKLGLVVNSIDPHELDRALQAELEERRRAKESLGLPYIAPVYGSGKYERAAAMAWLRKEFRQPRALPMASVAASEIPKETLLDKRLTGTYTYTRADGSVAYEILRFDGTPAKPEYRPKDFEFWRLDKPWPKETSLSAIEQAKCRSKAPWRRVDDRGVWIKNSKGVEFIPYGLDTNVLRAASEHRVLLWPEGEGKADFLRSLGFLATSTPIGERFLVPESWRDYVRGVDGIVFFADSSFVGRRFAERMRAMLAPAVPWTSTIDLFPDAREDEDVIDWSEGQDTQDPAELAKRLRALIQTERRAQKGRLTA